MDAAHALADLTEISSQIEAAALFEIDGAIAASTYAEERRAESFVASARKLLEAARRVRRGDPQVAQVEAATHAGSLFVVRDGTRAIAAATTPEPTVGLVFYDLKSALAAVPGDEPATEPKPRRKRKPKQADDGAA